MKKEQGLDLLTISEDIYVGYTLLYALGSNILRVPEPSNSIKIVLCLISIIGIVIIQMIVSRDDFKAEKRKSYKATILTVLIVNIIVGISIVMNISIRNMGFL